MASGPCQIRFFQQTPQPAVGRSLYVLGAPLPRHLLNNRTVVSLKKPSIFRICAKNTLRDTKGSKNPNTVHYLAQGLRDRSILLG